jgi:hypothetical protein
MRRFDVPRSYPPTWTDEPRMAVLWPDRPWAPLGTTILRSVIVGLRGVGNNMLEA